VPEAEGREDQYTEPVREDNEEVEPELDDVQDSAGPFALVFASGNDWYLKWHDTVASGFLVVPYSAVGARVGQPDDEVDR